MKPCTRLSRRFQRSRFVATTLMLQPSDIGYNDFVTSGQPAVLPDRLPVTPQSTTPLLSAGTTSANAMLTAVAPMPPRKSRMVLLNTRTFLPLRSLRPPSRPRHQNTCGGLPPKASSLAFQFFCIWRSITERYASHPARALSASRVMPARSQPSKRGSSPAILEISMPAKSITPRRSRRSMVLSSIPIWSSGVMSALIAPFEAFGNVSRQNGTSSTIEATVGRPRQRVRRLLRRPRRVALRPFASAARRSGAAPGGARHALGRLARARGALGRARAAARAFGRARALHRLRDRGLAARAAAGARVHGQDQDHALRRPFPRLARRRRAGRDVALRRLGACRHSGIARQGNALAACRRCGSST